MVSASVGSLFLSCTWKDQSRIELKDKESKLQACRIYRESLAAPDKQLVKYKYNNLL